MIYGVRLLNLSIAVCAAAVALSCSPKKMDRSTVTIQLPGSKNQKAFSQGISTLSFSDSTACYAVNVIASDIKDKGLRCSPPVGIFSGFKPANSTVTLEVPQGNARTIEIYFYNRVSATQTCAPDFSATSADKISRIGIVSNVNMTTPETSVSVRVNYPAAGESLVSQFGISATCHLPTANLAAVGTMTVLGAKAGIVTPENGYKAHVRITNNELGEVFETSGGYKLILGPKAK